MSEAGEGGKTGEAGKAGKAPCRHRRYRRRTEWSDWVSEEGWRVRRARRLPRCETCGAERPSRAPRRPIQEQSQVERPEPAPLPSPASRLVAHAVLRQSERRRRVSLRALLGRLARHDDLTGSALEEHLLAFAAAGSLRLEHALQGTRRSLAAVVVRDAKALAEHAEPGGPARRLAALEKARRRLAGLGHPLVDEVLRVLDEEERERQLAPERIAALAAVAAHAASGEVLSTRVLSARELGDSKALERARRSVESRLGPLEELGVREGGSLQVLGGSGRLLLGGGEERALDLAWLAPQAALARETVLALRGLELPVGGLLVVENLTVFEACCRGEAEPREPVLVAWSAGFPGRSVRRLVELARDSGARLRCWADLDLSGVRIARLVAGWAGERFEAHRMGPGELGRAASRRPLGPGARRAIESDLAARPSALLAETLRALLEAEVWVEQEALLGAPG